MMAANDIVRSKSTRKKKPSSKLRENDEWISSSDAASSLNKWCKVYCCEDSKIHILATKVMEPEDSEVLREEDLYKGNTLLWKFKGQRYTVTLLEVYSSKPSTPNTPPENVPSLAQKRERSQTNDDHNHEKIRKKRTPTPVKCTCLAELSKTLSTLKESIADVNSKVDRVYLAVQSRPPIPKIKITPPTPSTSSSETSDTEARVTVGADSKFISVNGVNLLGIRSLNPQKYALSLMDALFTDREMSGSCFSLPKRLKRGKEPKPQLSLDKIKLIEGIAQGGMEVHSQHVPGKTVPFHFKKKALNFG